MYSAGEGTGGPRNPGNPFDNQTQVLGAGEWGAQESDTLPTPLGEERTMLYQGEPPIDPLSDVYQRTMIWTGSNGEITPEFRGNPNAAYVPPPPKQRAVSQRGLHLEQEIPEGFLGNRRLSGQNPTLIYMPSEESSVPPGMPATELVPNQPAVPPERTVLFDDGARQKALQRGEAVANQLRGGRPRPPASEQPRHGARRIMGMIDDSGIPEIPSSVRARLALRRVFRGPLRTLRSVRTQTPLVVQGFVGNALLLGASRLCVVGYRHTFNPNMGYAEELIVGGLPIGAAVGFSILRGASISRTLGSFGIGFAGLIPISTAVVASSNLLGVDRESIGCQIYEIGMMSFLGALAPLATAGTGGVSAATLGLTWSGAGLSIGAGFIAGTGFFIGASLGNALDQALGTILDRRAQDLRRTNYHGTDSHELSSYIAEWLYRKTHTGRYTSIRRAH